MTENNGNNDLDETMDDPRAMYLKRYTLNDWAFLF